MSILDSGNDAWKAIRDAKILANDYDVSIWCAEGEHFVSEKVPNRRIVTIVDRKCGIIFEWSYFAQRWFKHDIRDWEAKETEATREG